LIKIACFTN